MMSSLDKLGNAFQDVVADPATRLASGNVFLSLHTGEPVSIALSSVTAGTTAALRAYQSVTNKPIGLPFYVLAAVNAGSAASIAVDAFNTNDPRNATAAVAFAAWAVGHYMAGKHEQNQTLPRNLGEDPQVYYGVGDLSAVNGDPVASAIFALGLAKALTGKHKDGENDSEVDSLKSFLSKHATPARIYGLGYLAGAILSLDQPYMAAAQTLWGAGYAGFDSATNGEMVKDAKALIKQSATQFYRNITALLPYADSPKDLAKSFPAAFSKVQDGLFDEAGAELIKIYGAPLDGDVKTSLFTILEVLAPRSPAVRQGIRDLAKEGDARAVEKMRRLGELAMGGVALSHPQEREIDNVKTVLRGLNPSTLEILA